MRSARILLAVLAALLASEAVNADPRSARGHIGWDITIGWPGPWYPYYSYPYYPYSYYPPRYYYYDYPPRIIVPSAPTEYIERDSQPPPPSYWYYCRSQNGYHPYVKECPSGWERVSPVPPAPPAQK
jgi:hypothetical protein